MTDSDESDVPVIPPEETPETSGPRAFGQHGWDTELRVGKRTISIAEGLALEWRDEISEGSSDFPTAQLISVDGFEVLEIETPADCGWIRLAVDLRQPGGSLSDLRRELYAQMTLQIVDPHDRGPVEIEPMIAVRTGKPGSPRREGQFATRVKLPLHPGQWHAVTSTFRFKPAAEETAHDIVVNLPRGARLRIARIEIDWLHASMVEAMPDAIETVAPFTATQCAHGNPGVTGSLSEPLSPSLEDIASQLSLPGPDLGALTAALLMRAEEPSAALLIECLFDFLGRKISLGAAAQAPLSTRIIAAAMLRRSMTRRGIAGSNREDRIALDALSQVPASSLRFRSEARRLGVYLTEKPSAEDLAHWQSHLDRGAIAVLSETSLDGQASGAAEFDAVLSVQAGIRMSPVGLAMLSVLAPADSGVEIVGEISDPLGGTWNTQGIEDISEERPTATVGHLRSGVSAGSVPLKWLLCRTAPKRAQPSGAGAKIPLDHAYAFVLCLEPGIDLASLLNLENCRVFSSLPELHAALRNASKRALMKPVVVLSRFTSVPPDYLIQAVAAHWRFGGKYVLSRCTVDYNSPEGKISLDVSRGVTLQPAAALAGVLSMPASELASRDSLPSVFIPSNRLVLAVPDVAMEASELGLLERQLGPDRRSPKDDEALARAGQIDAGLLAGMPLGPANWPIAELISRNVGQFRKLRHLLSESRSEVNAANASSVLGFLGSPSGDLLKLREEIGTFLLNLSQRPDIVLQLSKEELLIMVERSREALASDAIAHNLSLIAVELMRRNIDLLFPLFEFLACNLPTDALSTTFGFASNDLAGAPDRYVMRLAECMRRYGAMTNQALFLSALHTVTPKRLTNTDLLRTFAPLLASPLLPAVSAQVGSDVIRRIRASVPSMDKFQALVQAGDREGALRIFLDRQALAGVDFMHWMNNLRALSNELRQMALPVAEIGIDNCSSLPRRRLASIIFSDMESLGELDRNRELEFQSDLNAIARNILGDNRMLNDLVAAPFDKSGYRPMALEGETTGEVFRSARKSTEALAPIQDGPLITVIMSAFNPDLDLMAAALDSIRAQTWRNVEVIVIDDASDPEPATAIRGMVETMPRARLIRLDQNAGPYVGRNLALNVAEGEFIAIHDADDWAHPQRFEAQMAMMNNMPEAQVATTLHLRVDRAGHIQLERQFSLFGDGPMTSLFRRSVFETVGSFAKVRSRGDVEMRERIAGYFGHQALAVLPLPMMLCFADSATLSQRTAANSAEYLQLWRTNISRRGPMTSLFRDGVRLADWHQLSVPLALRAPDLENGK